VFVVVSYDIVDDARRLRVAKVLEDHGVRVQKSVFECDLRPGEMEVLRSRLQAQIDESEDSVRYYFLCESCLKKVACDGGPGPALDEEIMVI